MTYAQDRLAQLKAENKAHEVRIKARIRDIAVQAVKKGVGRPKGANHHAAKLNEDLVRSIRSMTSAGYTPKEIRFMLKLEDVVQLPTIYLVIARKTWAHI